MKGVKYVNTYSCVYVETTLHLQTNTLTVENFKHCEVTESFIWRFLVNVYHFNQDVFSANFGSTLKILLGNGQLNIIPYKYEWIRGLDLAAIFNAMINSGVSGCLKETDEDRLFHGILEAVGKMFNSKVSLFDIPKLFNQNLPPAKGDNTLRPTYSLCKIDDSLIRNEFDLDSGDYEDCFFTWRKAIKSYHEPEKNPYVNEKADNCAKGLSDAIG